jgi:hypothetical protein
MVSGYVGVQQADLDPPLLLNNPVSLATLTRPLREPLGHTGSSQ